MGMFGAIFGGAPGYVPSTLTGVATAESIRDQIYALLEALTPASLVADRFRRYRNEGAADFDAWAEANPAAAFRRLQVRQVGTDELPEASTALQEYVRMRFALRVAYPQTHRYGGENAMDRDDVMNEDWQQINRTVGIYGAGNFSGTNDCIPLGATMTRETGDSIDFLVVEIDVEFIRAVA